METSPSDCSGRRATPASLSYHGSTLLLQSLGLFGLIRFGVACCRWVAYTLSDAEKYCRACWVYSDRKFVERVLTSS